jgi:hypothetical protein
LSISSLLPLSRHTHWPTLQSVVRPTPAILLQTNQQTMAEEEPSGVLRLKRMEDPDSFVVVHVYSRGRNALDLELVASEGQSAWGTTSKPRPPPEFGPLT